MSALFFLNVESLVYKRFFFNLFFSFKKLNNTIPGVILYQQTKIFFWFVLMS